MNNLYYFDNGCFKNCEIEQTNGAYSLKIGEIADDVKDGLCVFPGFIDVHVHFREPGFSYKETIKTGSLAAAASGYTDVYTMPNLKPVPDSVEHIGIQEKIIEEDACIGVHPYASITKNQEGTMLSDIDALSTHVCGFSDDGKGVQCDEMMKQAMLEAKRLGKIIVAHCEVNDLLRGGYIHDGDYAKTHGHRGICSESEYKQIERDIKLVRETGVKYHVCHISTKESVEIIRNAKAEGLDVTCETGPHYLVLSDSDLQEDGRFKMNPPIRSEEDKQALIAGICDGTIDILATDHAPHSADEKSKGLEKSAMGIVGLETAFPVMYTKLVKTGVITLTRLIELMYYSPKARFGTESDVKSGCFTVFDLNKKVVVNPEKFISLGKATPFAGEELYGECVATYYNGKKVWERERTN